MNRNLNNTIMRISKNQNRIDYNRKTAVFVEYNGLNCDRCVFFDYSKEVCDGIPCKKEEREDGRTGHFRQTNVQQIENPYTILS